MQLTPAQPALVLPAALPAPRDTDGIAWRRYLIWVAGWGLAALAAIGCAWLLQIEHRASTLVWDEAARVRAGADLQTYLGRHDLAGAWTWAHSQTFYPFGMPAIHGVLMWLGLPPLTAAWLPALLAYGLAGVLTAQLALSLGGNRYAGWLAAALFWLCPLTMRLAAWGAMENIAACLFLGMTLALIRIERQQGAFLGVLAGVLAACACFLKYDFGLIAAATLVAAAPAMLLRTRQVPPFLATVLAILVAGLLVGFWLHYNHDAKLLQATAFIRQGHAYDGPTYSPAFYLSAVVGGDTGLAPLTGIVFLSGAAVAAYQALRGRLSATPVILLALAAGLYSSSQIKDVRFAATSMPFFAAFAALLLARVPVGIFARVADRRLAYGLLAVLALAATWQASVQLTAASGVGTRFSYLEPSASQAAFVEFATSHLKDQKGPVLYVGSTNWLSPRSLELVWRDSRPGRMPRVTEMSLEGVKPADALSATEALVLMSSASVLAWDIEPGSSLYDGDLQYLRQRQVLPYLQQLESEGVLRLEASLELEAGRVRGYYWAVVRD